MPAPKAAAGGLTNSERTVGGGQAIYWLQAHCWCMSWCSTACSSPAPPSSLHPWRLADCCIRCCSRAVSMHPVTTTSVPALPQAGSSMPDGCSRPALLRRASSCCAVLQQAGACHWDASCGNAGSDRAASSCAACLHCSCQHLLQHSSVITSEQRYMPGHCLLNWRSWSRSCPWQHLSLQLAPERC